MSLHVECNKCGIIDKIPYQRRLSNYLCSDCKKDLSYVYIIYDRDKKIGQIPKNLKEKYGQNI